MNRIFIVFLITLSVVAMSMGSISAASTAQINGYTVQYGDAWHPNHNSVNGIPFNDNAWALAFGGGYRFKMWDDHDQLVYDNGKVLYAASKTVSIPISSNVRKIALYVNAAGSVANVDDYSFVYTLPNDTVPSDIRGGFKFDGTTCSRNFHYKLYNDKTREFVFDSGYTTV